MSDDVAETRELDAPLPPELPPTHEQILERLAAMRVSRPSGPVPMRATFEEMHARILAAQEGLPLQRCPTCSATFRHHRGGKCHDCLVKHRRERAAP